MRRDEVNDGTAEQGCQVKKPVVQFVDAGIVRIEAGIVVDVEAGENVTLFHFVGHVPHHAYSGGSPEAWLMFQMRL